VWQSCWPTLPASSRAPDRPRRFTAKAAPSVEVLKVLAEDKDEAADREAGWIAQRILGLRREHGYDFRDFGVLCRTRDGMDPVLRALETRKIPTSAGAGNRIWSRAKAAISRRWSRCLANARDEVSLATVLRSPLVGVSDETLLALRLAANSVAGGLNTVIHDETTKLEEAGKLRSFAANLTRWRTETGTVPLDLLLSRAIPQRTPDYRKASSPWPALKAPI